MPISDVSEFNKIITLSTFRGPSLPKWSSQNVFSIFPVCKTAFLQLINSPHPLTQPSSGPTWFMINLFPLSLSTFHPPCHLISHSKSLFFPSNYHIHSPTGNYMFKVNNRNSRTRCKICSKLTIKAPQRRQWRRSEVFIFNFEHISQLVLVFLLLALNR